MSQMIRTFLAVSLPKETQSDLGQEIEKIKSTLPDWQVNWVKPENLHLTLIFLGWISEENIETLKTEVSTALKDFLTFEVSTGELSTLGRSLWFEIEKGGLELTKLHQQLKKELSIKGPDENRPFHAHLTIGRIKKKGKSKLLKVERSFSWKADRVILYKSRLRHGGPIYTPLASFPLNMER